MRETPWLLLLGTKPENVQPPAGLPRRDYMILKDLKQSLPPGYVTIPQNQHRQRWICWIKIFYASFLPVAEYTMILGSQLYYQFQQSLGKYWFAINANTIIITSWDITFTTFKQNLPTCHWYYRCLVINKNTGKKKHNDVATLKNKSSHSKNSWVSLQHFVVICKI